NPDDAGLCSSPDQWPTIRQWKPPPVHRLAFPLVPIPAQNSRALRRPRSTPRAHPFFYLRRLTLRILLLDFLVLTFSLIRTDHCSRAPRRFDSLRRSPRRGSVGLCFFPLVTRHLSHVTSKMKRILLSLVLLFAVADFLPAQSAPDAAELTKLLQDFLAGARKNDIAMHDRFWADELVYTSALGRR